MLFQVELYNINQRFYNMNKYLFVQFFHSLCGLNYDGLLITFCQTIFMAPYAIYGKYMEHTFRV